MVSVIAIPDSTPEGFKFVDGVPVLVQYQHCVQTDDVVEELLNLSSKRWRFWLASLFKRIGRPVMEAQSAREVCYGPCHPDGTPIRYGLLGNKIMCEEQPTHFGWSMV